MIKRVIFDVGHPAQVHNFKYISRGLRDRGWDILFTAKDKEITKTLLALYDLPYIIVGKTGENISVKILGFFLTFYRFAKQLGKFKPGIVICRFSLHSCLCCKLMNIPVIGLADTEYTKLLDFFTVPLVSVKLTAYSYRKNLGNNHIRFKGNLELLYLHPQRLNISNEILKDYDIGENIEFVLLRFVSWNAYHDIGEKGIPDSLKLELVRVLENRYKVLISSEKTLQAPLDQYSINFPPDKIHDVLAHASLYIGEGASMASEAACLGVPSVYINSLEAGSIKEEEEFGLVTSLRNSRNLLSIVQKLIDDSDLKQRTKNNLNSFLKDKIDVTSFLVWFIENYPESFRIMKEDPGYQNRFK